ncbi:error-prone repair protein UmuD [Pseudoroseomonas rhizosphaerae]|uniref:Error-prone repair protein UmuD n=1 Tax=Teichococcus rhizosphaerae TaxID=1335062 RepID=A0A2C7A4X4_9PROT|nr:S24 family peptidase [Pseudoroseomonas rhizosphaerae]PHK93400.1 error-prone repair protein UmuD [Pseudoroseomonas rhizosphaerae]
MAQDGYTGAETTGFVSPASDHLEGPIDLSEVLDLRRPNRYPVRVLGEALIDRGILPGDVLIADAAADPRPGAVAIVMLHGEVLVAQLAHKRGQWWLRPGRRDQPAVPVSEDMTLWAVVAALVRERV